MTPIMSISGLGGPTPSFVKGGGGTASFELKYFMHGDQIGTWRMYWSDGDYGTGTLTALQFNAPTDGGDFMYLAGEKQTAEGNAWRVATVDLSEFWGQSGRLVFIYIKTASGWRGDIAWDTMKLIKNDVETDYSVGSTTSQWKCTDPGKQFTTLAAAVSDWADGDSGTESTPTTSYSTVPAVLKTGRTASNSNTTGPSSGDGGSGYYMYIETSNVTSINMYSANRYCYTYTTEISLTP